MAAKKDAAEKVLPPGRYEVALNGCTGYIQFPAPLMLHHFKAWWERSVEATAGLKPETAAYWEAQWQAYKRLLLDFGEWAVAEVARGEVEADNLPLELEEFVLLAGEDYILPKLAPAKRRLRRSAF